MSRANLPTRDHHLGTWHLSIHPQTFPLVNVDSMDADRMAIGPLAGSPSRSPSFTVNTAAHKHRLPGWLAQPEGKVYYGCGCKARWLSLLLRCGPQ